MYKYKFTDKRWGLDKEYILTDIETGQHCVGTIHNRTTVEVSKEYTLIKFPTNIDGFHIDVPCGQIWIEKGSEYYYFGDLKIEYFGTRNKEEHELFSTLVNESLLGNRNSAIELLKQLGKSFILESIINEFDFSKMSFNQLCSDISSLMHDRKISFNFIQLGAFKGNSYCQEKLGCCYEHGYYGVTKNLKIAIKWYKKAAEGKSVRAMSNLAEIYNYECISDLKKFFYWAKKSAEHGSISYIASLSVLYELGIGYAKNLRKARYWYEIMINLPKYKRRNAVWWYNRILRNYGLSLTERPHFYNKELLESIILQSI